MEVYRGNRAKCIVTPTIDKQVKITHNESKAEYIGFLNSFGRCYIFTDEYIVFIREDKIINYKVEVIEE